MGQQMEKNQPIPDAYGHYAGSQEYAQPYQEPIYASKENKGSYDEAFMDDLAQRIAQRMPQNATGKVYEKTQNKVIADAGQRLGLAIVSVVILIPLAGVAFGAIGGFGGVIAFAIGCLAIIIVNAIFNNVHW